MGMMFERQARESAKAFAAFSAYLEMGPERSLAKVARKLTKSGQLIKRWSSRYDWPARVKAHGAHLAEVGRKAAEEVARVDGVEQARTEARVKDEAWQEAEGLIEMAREFKRRWRSNDEKLPGFETVVRALEMAFRLKAFAVGIPLEVKQVNTTLSGADGGPLRIEIEAALDKAYGKPIPGEIVEVESPESKVQSQEEGVHSLQSAVSSEGKRLLSSPTAGEDGKNGKPGNDGEDGLLTSSPTNGGAA